MCKSERGRGRGEDVRNLAKKQSNGKIRTGGGGSKVRCLDPVQFSVPEPKQPKSAKQMKPSRRHPSCRWDRKPGSAEERSEPE